MTRALFSVALIVAAGAAAHATDACQDYAKRKDLPASFKMISRTAIGPAQVEMMSDGACTCNNLPAVQRSLGQAEPPDVNFACDVADSSDSKSK